MDLETATSVRMLAADLRAHMRHSHLSVLALDRADALASVDAELVRPGEIGAADDPALRPLFLQFLLEREETVVLLDPETRIFGALHDLEQLAHEHGIVLVPTVLEPLPLDGRSPSEPDLQALGIYNSGCLAVGRGAAPFLAWHCAHLRERSERDLPAGWSLDDRWVDFVPAYFDHHVLRDPGVGVGSWNLHERRLTREDGRYLANGAPLRTFNFRDLGSREYSFHSRLPFRVGAADLPDVARLLEHT